MIRTITTVEELAQLLKYGYHLFIDHNQETAHIDSLDGYHPVEYAIACAFVNKANNQAMETTE